MIRITKSGKYPQGAIYNHICENCDCEFEFEWADIIVRSINTLFVCCPECNNDERLYNIKPIANKLDIAKRISVIKDAMLEQKLRHEFGDELFERLFTEPFEPKIIEGWLAADADGHMYLYENEPTKSEASYNSTGMLMSIDAFTESFPAMAFDDEPIKLKLTIEIA